MKLSNELILEVADFDQVSIECASCGVRVDLSLIALNKVDTEKSKKQEVPGQCPACFDKWQEIRNALGQFSLILTMLQEHRIYFRVPAPPAMADKKG